MKRILLVLSVALVLAAMLAITASAAFALSERGSDNACNSKSHESACFGQNEAGGHQANFGRCPKDTDRALNPSLVTATEEGQPARTCGPGAR